MIIIIIYLHSAIYTNCSIALYKFTVRNVSNKMRRNTKIYHYKILNYRLYANLKRYIFTATLKEFKESLRRIPMGRAFHSQGSSVVIGLLVRTRSDNEALIF